MRPDGAKSWRDSSESTLQFATRNTYGDVVICDEPSNKAPHANLNNSTALKSKVQLGQCVVSCEAAGPSLWKTECRSLGASSPQEFQSPLLPNLNVSVRDSRILPLIRAGRL